MPQTNGGSRTLRSRMKGNFHVRFWRPVRDGDISTEFNPSKTKLVHTLEQFEQEQPGFDFLGLTIRQYSVGKYQTGKSSNGEKLGFKTIITPSKEKLKIHYDRIAEVIAAHKAVSSRFAPIKN